ncbi:MAG: type I DNA topoisomerase [Patescibacteria group bacterium]|nr:type I DNA topoisomerase [Patescibacteria group bacterium]
MKLVIVESPSKAKTIGKYLGDGFTVLASVGHVRDLPKSNKKAIDIEGGFIPHYEITPKKEHVIDEIRRAAVKADEILLATDPDREGEAIAWHLKELLTDKKIGGNIDNKKIKRITYHEITREAVEEAIAHPREIDEHLREAQEARRVLDRLVGYDLSGVIWKKVRYGLSAGRVQSPALRIIMEREREIRVFKPEDFWTISGLFKTEYDKDLTLTCVEEPRDKNKVEHVLAAAKTGSWHVVDIEESEQKRSPRAPFITSTLQQTASTRFGFTPSRTMGIAQKLYEAGHITYMRTDSTTLSKNALGQIAGAIEKNYGKEYLQFRTYSAKSKNAQEAHEAIRPTTLTKMSAGTTDEQKKLYRLIWARTIASQMADAKLAKTKIVANIESKTIPDFVANGSRVIFDGWLKADPESAGEDIALPAVNKDEGLKLITIDSEAKQTQPPGRYTEAGLIKELEKRDIGRPSTYATITRTIEDRGYVEKENKSLKPTDTGDVVSTFLETQFPTYISDTFTAEMEDKLDAIAEGNAEYTKTLSDFYKPFSKEVKAKDKLDKATTLGQADPKFKCPKCGTTMVIKLGRGGKFLSCSRYPDCDGALTMEGHEIKKDEPIGTDPATGLPIFVLSGRFGPYVQLGEERKKEKGKRKTKKKENNNEPAEATNSSLPVKAKKASVPKGVDLSKITVAEALKYLSLPRTLGKDPATGVDIVASAGRFGPYVVRSGDYRSIKLPLNPYDITLDQALALLSQEKKKRGFAKKKV